MRLNNSRNHGLIVSLISIALLVIPVFGCSSPAAAPAATDSSAPLYTNPKLGVAPMTMDLQFKAGAANTVTKQFTIANEGEGVMVWAATKNAPWLWMNEANGALEKGYSKTQDVFFAPSGLDPGTYTDNITVEAVGSRNSPQLITVTLLIKPADAPVTDVGGAVLKKPVPAPPWDYSEFKDDTYHFRLRYPKDYTEKQIVGWNFGAVSSSKVQADTILLSISSSYGVDFRSASVELVKSAVRAGGGTPRQDPKVILDDNTTTLADGATPAYEMLYEAKTGPTLTYQVYLFGTQKGSRYIIFAATAPLPYAADRVDLWKQIGHTMEFLD
jgi:hypothetical protein